MQIIYEVQGFKIPKIEYEVYYPIYNNNFTKLNLSLCLGTKVEISIPVKINDSLDKYNPKSGYYNNICYKTTSKSGTDIILKDRRNEFVENNMTLCEEKCDLIDYNYNNEKVKCSCDVKTKISPIKDIKFNKNEFFKSFIDINNISNISIIKCYKIVLDIKNLIYNYGFYIIGSIMILFIISAFIFWFIYFKKLMKNLFNICIVLNNNKSIEAQSMVIGKKNLIKKKIKIKRKKKKKKKNTKNINIENSKENNLGIEKKINFINNIKQDTQNNEDKSSNRLKKIEYVNFNINDINKQYANDFLEQKDFEINSLEYEEAYKLDKRNYFIYYISLLKNSHPLIFSFYCYNDYNSQIIKIFLFFFSFSSDLTINALFFNDDSMHKIYQDKGKYDFLYQIPQILYSTLISKLIDILIKNLALSQDDIVVLKQEKEKINVKEKYSKMLKLFKIKFILFFVFAFIILSFYWYYITCFCGIYVNTQIHLIKDSVSSLLTSFIFPFVINLIPGLFRIPALRMEKPCGQFLYKFSAFLENYLT